MNEVKEIGVKSIYTFVGKIAGYLIQFLYVILATRLLGAETYGEFVFITSFLAFFAMIPNMGLDRGLTAFLARNNLSIKVKQSLLSFTILISLIVSVFIVVVSVLFQDIITEIWLGSVVYQKLFLILLPTIILNTINLELLSSLNAYRKIIQMIKINELMIPTVKVVALIIMSGIFHVNSYYSLVIPLYIANIVALICYICTLKKLDAIGWIEDRTYEKELLLTSFPLLFAGVINVIYHNVDKYMIGILEGVTEVAIYNVALQFGTVSVIALTSVNVIFRPLIVKCYYDNDFKKIQEMYVITTKWIITINLMIFGMILVFSEDIMHVSGEEFIVGSMALILIAMGQVVNAAVGSVGNINQMTGKPSYMLISAACAMVVNITLNILLIPMYGINGAAIATAIALAIQNVIGFGLMYRRLKLNPYNRSYLNILLVFLLSTTGIFCVSQFFGVTNFIMKLIICGVIYVGIFVLLTYGIILSKWEKNVVTNYIVKIRKR